MTAFTFGSRVRVAPFDLRFCTRRYASDAVGEVIHVSCREDGTLSFEVAWDRPSPTQCLALGWRDDGPWHTGHGTHAAWLVGEDVKRDEDGYVIEDCLPDMAAVNFASSVATFGCAWSGDVRETGAWICEDPQASWWDPWRHPRFSSLNERLLCEYAPEAAMAGEGR